MKQGICKSDVAIDFTGYKESSRRLDTVVAIKKSKSSYGRRKILRMCRLRMGVIRVQIAKGVTGDKKRQVKQGMELAFWGFESFERLSALEKLIRLW